MKKTILLFLYLMLCSFSTHTNEPNEQKGTDISKDFDISAAKQQAKVALAKANLSAHELYDFFKSNMTKTALNIYDYRYPTVAGLSLIAAGTARQLIFGRGLAMPLVAGLGTSYYVVDKIRHREFSDEEIDQKIFSARKEIKQAAIKAEATIVRRLESLKQKQEQPIVTIIPTAIIPTKDDQFASKDQPIETEEEISTEQKPSIV